MRQRTFVFTLLALAAATVCADPNSCYTDKATMPFCWRLRAYGTEPDKKESMGYFIVPVGICNHTSRKLVRYFLEPSVGEWFNVQCADQDFKDSWVCGKYSPSDFADKIQLSWNGNLDGSITSNICTNGDPNFSDFEDDDFLPAVRGCEDFKGGACASQGCCPKRGFNTALFVFRVGIANGRPWTADTGSMQPLIWIGPAHPSDQILRRLAADFLDQIRRQQPAWLPLEGCLFPCCPSVWLDTGLEVLELLLNPDDPEPTAKISQPTSQTSR